MAAVLLLCGLPAMAQEPTLPRASFEADFKRLDCFVEINDALRDQQSFDVDGGKKLVLVPCLRGAYQSSSIVYVLEGATARLLTFRAWDGKRFKPTEFMTEAEFDPVAKAMSSFAKGRGIGDCGSLGQWKWNGAEFKLAKYFHKEKCDGRIFAGQRRWQVFPRR
jgi:Protein of unknown function (DUF1176)